MEVQPLIEKKINYTLCKTDTFWCLMLCIIKKKKKKSHGPHCLPEKQF